MAKIRTKTKIPPLKINKFLGLNLDETGDTQIQLGESGNMTNWYITKDMKLSKIEGYKSLMPEEVGTPIRGMAYENVNGSYHFVFVYNNKVYKFLDEYWKVDTTWETDWISRCIDLGTVTDEDVTFFPFNNKLYLLNGDEYYSWDGNDANDFIVVAGYEPLIAIGTSPDGTGFEDYESSNLLNGIKRQQFNGDAIATYYQLYEVAVTSIDSVLINGSSTSAYTVDLTLGRVIPNTPADFTDGENNVEIKWTKGSGSRSEVVQNMGAKLGGPGNNTRVFMYGNPDARNKIIYSALAGEFPSVEYFTATTEEKVGSLNSGITDIQKIYERMIITKDDGKASYMEYDVYQDNGKNIVNFPVYDLNDSHGNVAFGQGQVINNYPVTIDKGLVYWLATNVKDEKNAQIISDKIRADLDTFDLSEAKTVDWQERTEHWTALDEYVYIYNYYLSGTDFNVFSRLKLNHKPNCFLVIDGELYFGTKTGEIMKFSSKYRSYAGEPINAYWEMNFYDYGDESTIKNMSKIWVSLLPQAKASATLNYISNIDGLGEVPEEIEYALSTFEEMDFSDFSFLTNYNPQPFMLKLKAKKFNYMKLIVENNSDTDDSVILSLRTKVEYGGESK